MSDSDVEVVVPSLQGGQAVKPDGGGSAPTPPGGSQEKGARPKTVSVPQGGSDGVAGATAQGGGGGSGPPSSHKESWQEAQHRLLIVSCQTRSIRREQIAMGLMGAGFGDFEAIGRFSRGFAYQVLMETKEEAEALADRGYLIIVTPQGRVRCPVRLFLKKEFRIRVDWLPCIAPADVLESVFSRYGNVIKVVREWAPHVRGMPRYLGGTFLVTIIPDTENVIESIPDFLDVALGGQIHTVLCTVLGLPPRCHRCHQRGHLVRDCLACRHCGGSDHTSEDHASHNASQRRSFASVAKPKETPTDLYEEFRITSDEEDQGEKEGENRVREDVAKLKEVLEISGSESGEITKWEEAPERDVVRRESRKERERESESGEDTQKENWQEVVNRKKKRKFVKKSDRASSGHRSSSQDSRRGRSRSPLKVGGTEDCGLVSPTFEGLKSKDDGGT